jgi:hypothetical protein
MLCWSLDRNQIAVGAQPAEALRPRNFAIPAQAERPDRQCPKARLSQHPQRLGPHKVVALKAPTETAAAASLPLLAGKPASGPVTTYICENFTCAAPVVGAAPLEQTLGGQLRAG